MMSMDERIYIPPKRPRLGLDKPDYRLRHLSFVLAICALITGLIYLVLK